MGTCKAFNDRFRGKPPASCRHQEPWLLVCSFNEYPNIFLEQKTVLGYSVIPTVQPLLCSFDTCIMHRASLTVTKIAQRVHYRIGRAGRGLPRSLFTAEKDLFYLYSIINTLLAV